MEQDRQIVIKGARQHNLKNIDLRIPRDAFVVITGVSGSGKSSLAFDTIYAEGQRRYVESLSPYARQFLELMEKPDVDLIEGLSPAIAIEQKALSKNPRSTVATVTEIYDYLRLLFARLGKPYCPHCEIPISVMTISNMVDEVLGFPAGTKLILGAPVVRGKKGEFRKELEIYKRQGFLKAKIDGQFIDLHEIPELNKNLKHEIVIIVDRLVIKDGIRQRLADSMEMAAKLGSGIVSAEIPGGRSFLFNQNFACNSCGFTFSEISPRMFSFNNPYGACSTCDGLGTRRFFDPVLIVRNDELSLKEGAIRPWMKKDGSIRHADELARIARHFSIPLNTPFKKLPEAMRQFILLGRESGVDAKLAREIPSFTGVIPWLEHQYRRAAYEEEREIYEGYMSFGICPACKGKRLKAESLAIKIQGVNIHDISCLTIEKAGEFFSGLEFKGSEELIARRILKEIRERLGFLNDVGLSYLTLERSAMTLSGGEAQRINLATQIGSKLVGVLYVLDEPSIGLHPRDNGKLIQTLKNLRDIGNTVLVVEHDEETIMASDWVIDLGPGAGEKGGDVVAQGTPGDIMKSPASLTGSYLSGIQSVELPDKRKGGSGRAVTITRASGNNLKEISVRFPLEKFICVTGVSGSGKSTLVIDTLYRAVAQKFYGSRELPGKHSGVKGLEYIDKVIDVDQSPIGRTPRSNPATYTGLFTPVRELFAMIPEAKMRGYTAGRFSFNVRGGRCESCNGEGFVKIEMHFMPDVYVVCEQCEGKRFNRETLEIRFKGKTIWEVLDMTVTEAERFFENIPRIRHMLEVLDEVGLGYMRLGQPATTLSGGEAQRVKLAKELVKRGTGNTLYILDEPTTGLHFDDVRKLLHVLHKLVTLGNTVIVIEHNIDVIKTADWIIDLGPEGGEKGGYLVAEGTPEEIVKTDSYMAEYLKKALKIPRS